MKELLARRPSPALIVATIALICALTGTAWAALGKNSVGSKQLKSNAVTAAKIKKEAVTANKVKKDTLTGKQINEAKLGPVPVANSIPPAEATHLVGAPGEPPFEGGSSNAGVLEGSPVRLNNVGFFKDHEGLVHLEGVARVGKPGTGFGPIFTLPVGYRPAQGTVVIVPGIGGSSAALIGGSNTLVPGLDISGKVIGSEGELVVLDGYTFRPGS